jgi:hypothetical protein
MRTPLPEDAIPVGRARMSELEQKEFTLRSKEEINACPIG